MYNVKLTEVVYMTTIATDIITCNMSKANALTMHDRGESSTLSE